MGAGAADTSSGHLGREPFLAEMSSPQIRSLLERGGIDVLIPLGALEQHGPHLPLGTDTLIALAMATRVARRVGNLLIAPCLPVGCSDHHLSFAGTASLSEEVTSAYIRSVSLTLLRHGFRYAYIISGHAGNIPAMKKATSSLPEEVAGKVIAFVDWPTQRDAMHEWAEKSLGLSSEEVGSHSGHFETSVMLDLAPDLVNMSTAPRGFIGPVQEATRVMRDEGIAAVSDVGVVGDARRATSSAGSAYMEMLVRSLAGGIEQHRSTARGGF